MRTIPLLITLLSSATLFAQLGSEHRFIYPTTNQGLGVHDMDGDGDGDILRDDAGRLRIDEQITPNEFRITTDLGAAAGIDIIRFGDIDGDGIEDVVFALPNDGSIVWVRVLGGGLYAPIQNLVTGLYHPFDVRLADVDGDMDLDLVHADSSMTLEWNANLGGGNFGQATSSIQVRFKDRLM